MRLCSRYVTPIGAGRAPRSGSEGQAIHPSTIPISPTVELSIIVPTLDEERAIGPTLEHLIGLKDDGCVADVVVSDGGSRDRTGEIARRFPVSWVEGAPGRGGQLNRGAAAARGEVLLFVHADTRLPVGATGLVARAIADGADGGGFEVRFVGGAPLMALGSRLASLRTRWTRLPLGDQAQFVRHDTFDRLGGYREWPILEDLDLMRRLKRLGRVTVLPAAVATSDRRFAQRGVARTLGVNYTIWALYALGVSPTRLARLYRQVR
jgi:rSAM/selenodomain-associated transferase 2